MQERVKRFDGVRNFRDFGGYRGADGAMVATGKLFRSAHFAEASEEDQARLDGLGVDLLVDLRRPQERQVQPNRWPPAEGPVRVVVNDEGEHLLPPHVAVLMRTDLEPAHVETFMVQLYADMPFDARHRHLFSSFLRGLAAGEGGAVVHCAAGKDRTGVLCALTHFVLGVSPDDVFADYDLTNAAVDMNRHLPEVHAKIEAGLGRTIAREALVPLVGVRESYLHSALNAIQDQAGDPVRYVEEVLGVTPQEQARLRDRFLA